MLHFLTEFWLFARARKKYWLLPILIVCMVLAALIALTSGSPIAPFIYAIF